MPPKGKGKKSKKQLEEERRIAEEERKAQEELERKLAEEEAERQRIAEEKRRAEEEKRRQEELKRLAEEMPEEQQRAASMQENARFAQLARVTDLDEKTLACDPLPDVDRETDLNTFITQWKESPDTTLEDAITQCQIAENVITSMQDKLGEALSMYDTNLLRWCHNYVNILREIELRKFDEISAYVFEFMDNHTKLSPSEIAKQSEQPKGRIGKGEKDRKEVITMVSQEKDLIFGIWANVTSKSKMHQDIFFNNYIAQLPQKQSSGPVVLRCLWTSYDYLTPYKIQDDYVVGGIVDFQLYNFPEQSKSAGKWCMRQILTVEQRLRNIPFPDPSAHTMTDMPVEIKFYLPKNIYIESVTEVKIAVWHSEREEWTQEFTGEVAGFKFEERLVKFSTLRFAPMAMLQSRCTDYPYQNWKLRCIADNTARLDLFTKRLQLVFEISPLQLKLVNCEEPALAHLADRDGLSPGYLLQELAKCGILLMPRDEDAQLAGIEMKDRAAEERAIIDVALGVRAFHFRSCKWNQTRDPSNPGVPPENIVMRIRENLEFDMDFLEDYEPDWRYVMWWSNKVSFVEGCKQSQEDNCNAQIAEGHLTHGLLSQACEPPHCSEAANLLAKDFTQIEFTDTVKKTLRLLRLFAFS